MPRAAEVGTDREGFEPDDAVHLAQLVVPECAGSTSSASMHEATEALGAAWERSTSARSAASPGRAAEEGLDVFVVVERGRNGTSSSPARRIAITCSAARSGAERRFLDELHGGHPRGPIPLRSGRRRRPAVAPLSWSHRLGIRPYPDAAGARTERFRAGGLLTPLVRALRLQALSRPAQAPPDER